MPRSQNKSPSTAHKLAMGPPVVPQILHHKPLRYVDTMLLASGYCPGLHRHDRMEQSLQHPVTAGAYDNGVAGQQARQPCANALNSPLTIITVLQPPREPTSRRSGVSIGS
ncbi:hypothetical protein FIBSPDRAFT_21411 [Athelia psychrophila]|uniref:Uncharacterized protein n=1 Tax=Athelia psychrophila TaxID=1759441 RepID=A0A166UEW4_9AGAM|nr:hypothetical protein FIBSPDRAFT_21411 [Fibularhizoctonia sp. CBS 109695]